MSDKTPKLEKDSISSPSQARKNIEEIKKDSIEYYQFYTQAQGVQSIDTSLQFEKAAYAHNLLYRDLFDLNAFANMGQGYQKLSFEPKYSRVPNMGFPAKEWIYLSKDHIKYFDVISPTTWMKYQSGLEKGQATDIIFTINLTEKWNTTFNYIGLNSLGKYFRSLSDGLQWYISSQYLGETYRFKLHYALPNDIQ